MGSIHRNHARLDIQLYVDIPNDKLDEIGKPGWKRNAIDLVNLLVVGAESPEELLAALQPYAVEWRTKVSGGNIQLARDTHMRKP